MARRTKVVNLDRLKRKLQAMPQAIRTEIETALGGEAGKIVASMKRLVPVDLGALRDSIHVEKTQAGEGRPSASRLTREAGLSWSIVAGGEGPWGDAFYARWVEFGTAPHSVASGANLDANKSGGTRQSDGPMHPGAEPHPFFFPVYRAHRKAVRRRARAAVTRAGKKVARMAA